MSKILRFASKDTCCCNGGLRMPTWICWFLGADGLTIILTQSRLFRFVRDAERCKGPDGNRNELGKFLHCPMCMGFWVGVLFFLLFGPPFDTSILWSSPAQSAYSWMLAKLHLSWDASRMPALLGACLCGWMTSNLAWSTHLVRAKFNETLGL